MDDLLKRLMAALDQGLEVTVTLKKPAVPKPENVVKCPHCGWKKAYSRHDAAQRGWEAHKKKCSKRKSGEFDPPQWLIDQSKGENNGHQ